VTIVTRFVAVRWARQVKEKWPGFQVLGDLSRTLFDDRSGTEDAIALTSVEPRAGYALSIELRKTTLPKRRWARISQVGMQSTEGLAGRISACDPMEHQQLVEGLNEIVGRA